MVSTESVIKFLTNNLSSIATPLRSSNISRCGSVEVISDVELTSSESIQSCKVNLKRRRDPASGTPHRQRQKTLATIAFRSALLSFDEFADNGMDQVGFRSMGFL